MNNDISVYCSFYGKEFSAKKLKDITNLPLIIFEEKDENSLIGRYKGKLCPYSSAKLDFFSDKPIKIQLEELQALLQKHKNEIDKFIIESIEINVTLSYKQGKIVNYTTVNFDRNLKLLNIETAFTKTKQGELFLASLGLVNKTTNIVYKLSHLEKSSLSKFNNVANNFSKKLAF